MVTSLIHHRRAVLGAIAVVCCLAGTAFAQVQVRTARGTVEGAVSQDSKIRIFKGIPYAAPPVGQLRWQPPKPADSWQGIRKATAFGPRCMQTRVFDDMIFRDEASEDCLYANVWTPAKKTGDRLPVMVWIYGGGFQAGSASEPRQDGERLAHKGVVVVSFNYRLGIFGFFSHPELTNESPNHASGDYGLLDQVAALKWVAENIAEFGGDPKNVTIFGESAGSFSVSALMASPLAKGLFHRAIGESGAFFSGPQPTLPAQPLAASEKTGANFASKLGANSLPALRAKPADEILKAVTGPMVFGFSPNIDGYFLPQSVGEIFSAGKQARVPLLAGWNADEVRSGVVLAKTKTTAASFAAQAKQRFGDSADALLKVYPASNDAEALESAASLASDLFIGYSTWKWLEADIGTGNAPAFRYSFDRKIPVAPDTKVNGVPATAADIGARHAGEIEYVFGALDSVAKVTWQPEDRKISELMMSYWSNFARRADPNGPGLPKWPAYKQADGYQVLHLDTTTVAAADRLRARYEFLDLYAAKKKSP
jgi:para-nitrobenzyl esterase